jgi:hypothetical protein
MSITLLPGGLLTPALYESLLLHDRSSAWWGLDTSNPLEDDSGHGYVLTAIGAPANAATLLTRGDNGLSGCRDFNGTTDGYSTPGTVTTAPDGPPAFQDSTTSQGTTTANADVLTPGGVTAGDLVLTVITHSTPTATVSTIPAGWTQVGTTLNAGTHAVAVFKRTPSADDPPNTYTWVWSVTGSLLNVCLLYRGADSAVSGLVFDAGLQVTASGVYHTTTTETNPAGARAVAIWTAELASLTITPYSLNISSRVDVSNVNMRVRVADYDVELAGSLAQSAGTNLPTTLGAILITFGSAPAVVSDALSTTQGATLHAIIQPDTIVGVDGIVGKYQAYGVHLNAGVVEFYYRDGGGTDRVVTGPSVSAGVTSWLVVVDDGTNINFYKNGSRTTSARVGAAGYTPNTQLVRIGCEWTGAANGNFFDGRIDEPAIWDGAITLQMVSAWWRAYKDGLFGEFLQANKAGDYPRAKLEIAWLSRPTDDVLLYDDATADLRADPGISTTGSGRNFELDRIESGRMDFTLDNRSRKYDSDYTGSVLYPHVKPTRAVRFRAQSAVDQPVHGIFFGYTEGPGLKRLSMGKDAVAEYSASDVFKALALDKISSGDVRETELAGARLAHVLSGVPGIPYRGEASIHRVIGDSLEGVNRLDHAQAVVETDGGVLFADSIGYVRFQDNQHRAKYERTVRATYGDGWASNPELPVVQLEPAVDEARLFTKASVTPSSGEIKSVQDDAAVLEHFVRTKEVPTVHADDNDAQAMAEAYAHRYSTPRERIPSLAVKPAGALVPTVMWETVLAHELSHRIKGVERSVAGVNPISRELFIEGVDHKVTGEDWEVSFSTSPADLDGDYWILGTGKLGDTSGPTSTRLGW